MVRVENAMLKHINDMAGTVSEPICIYADSPAMKKGRPTSQMRRYRFVNPEPGVLLTHIVGLDQVRIEVHHRDDSSRYTDFALVFLPLQLVYVRAGKMEPWHGGPYTVRVEFKTSDEGSLYDVRVAGAGGAVDVHAIPDPEFEAPRKRPSATGMLGGMLKSVVRLSIRRASQATKGLSNFKELEDDDDEDSFHAHNALECLKAWLKEEVAIPLETIIKTDIAVHLGKGY